MAAPAHTGKHVLVINDDPTILELFREFLAEEGYRVSLDKFERDTGSLLASIREARPDLLILDFIIGGEDKGWQLLQALRMDRATRAIPVIVCTAAVRQVTEMSAHLNELGIQAVLKPFDIDHLLQIVTAAWTVEATRAAGPDTVGSEETA